MNPIYIYIGFAIYIITDIIFSVLMAAKNSAREAVCKETINTIKKVVGGETSSSDRKIKDLRFILNNLSE